MIQVKTTEINSPIASSIVWFYQDLRLEDQPALVAAIEKGGPVIPLFIWAPEEEGKWAVGEANQWWMHHSLKKFSADLKNLGLDLIICQGNTLENLLQIIEETGADAVFWNRRYEPYFLQRDAHIKAELKKKEIKAQSFNGRLLFEPWTVSNKQNKPFQVFTPFWKHCMNLQAIEIPLKKPVQAIKYEKKIKSLSIDSLQLLPKIHWDKGMEEYWQPGEENAHKNLEYDLTHVIQKYKEQRDYPSIQGTSQMSPYLQHGEISPRSIWHAVKKKYEENPEAEAYLRQIMWREFGYHLLYHFPHTPDQPLSEKFHSFPWKKEEKQLKAWQSGQTGYPIVDAGMRQLWHIGWMHNRLRLIVASFLVKDLLISWQDGEKWFWNTLVDADLANNTLGWQWIAGCGADAAPYFRIFNPITQGEKFDEKGVFVRKWVPEIAALPDEFIHRPWEAPENILRQAGITLGTTYPKPLVDHAQAREKALEALSKI